MSVFNRPKIEVYIGITGSGKGVSVNARLKELAPRRLLLWDPRNEYAKWAPRFDSLRGLAGAVDAAKGGPFKARYVAGSTLPLEKQFAFVCDLAFAAGNMVFGAEELSDVTKPSYAPPSWKRIITQGRHQGLHVFGMAQRPALVDKNIFGNATYLRCFMLGYANDRKVMADELDVDPEQVKQLRTSEELRGQWMHTTINYIERFKREGMTQAGQIKLKRKLDAEELAEIQRA